MKAVIEKGELIITIPVNAKPVPSTSGKTLQVASSHGNTPTNIQVDNIGLLDNIPTGRLSASDGSRRRLRCKAVREVKGYAGGMLGW